ncbi:hypothetical protein XPA_007230 [Xanthoria parietina]
MSIFTTVTGDLIEYDVFLAHLSPIKIHAAIQYIFQQINCWSFPLKCRYEYLVSACHRGFQALSTRHSSSNSSKGAFHEPTNRQEHTQQYSTLPPNLTFK